jgi:hypothetical protein
MKPADVILALLEEKELIADTLFDENPPCMLLDNAFLVLLYN